MLERIITNRATPWVLLTLALIGAPGLGISLFALLSDPAETVVDVDSVATPASMAASYTAAPQEVKIVIEAPTAVVQTVVVTREVTVLPTPEPTAEPTEEPPSATPIPSPVSPTLPAATATGVVLDTATAAVADPTPTASPTPSATPTATATLTPTPELVCSVIPADPDTGWILSCRDAHRDTDAFTGCSDAIGDLNRWIGDLRITAPEEVDLYCSGGDLPDLIAAYRDACIVGDHGHAPATVLAYGETLEAGIVQHTDRQLLNADHTDPFCYRRELDR